MVASNKNIASPAGALSQSHESQDNQVFAHFLPRAKKETTECLRLLLIDALRPLQEVAQQFMNPEKQLILLILCRYSILARSVVMDITVTILSPGHN